MYFPAAKPPTPIVSTELPEPPGPMVTLVELNERPGPAGDTVALKLTVPEKPLTPMIVTVEDPFWPFLMLRLEGLALIEKSGAFATATVIVTVTE